MPARWRAVRHAACAVSVLPPMDDLARERFATRQLHTVAAARRLRLQALRQQLAQREQALAQAHHQLTQDEQLLDAQWAVWAGRRSAWALGGGLLQHARVLQADRSLLKDMAGLLAQRRAALQAAQDQLSQALTDWARRWQAALALEDALAQRAAAAQRAQQRSAERAQDEQALQAWQPATGRAMRVPLPATWVA